MEGQQLMDIEDEPMDIEQPWTDRTERYMKSIMEDCSHKSNVYDVGARNAKSKYNMLSIPSIVLPIGFSISNGFIPDEYNYLNSISLGIVSILNGLSAFFNFSKKFQLYSEYSNKYNQIVDMIELELNKDKKYRTNIDVFTERIKILVRNLDENSPFI